MTSVTRRQFLAGIGTGLAGSGIAGCSWRSPGPIYSEYPTTTIHVESPDGTERGTVTAAIADTRSLQVLGLSDTERLQADWGMVFVYESVADRTFVMREMDFGIDIVYADAAGTITTIHHAPAPGPEEDGSNQEYPGRGQYVVEVNYDWTTDHGVTTGDQLQFQLPDSVNGSGPTPD